MKLKISFHLSIPFLNWLRDYFIKWKLFYSCSSLSFFAFNYHFIDFEFEFSRSSVYFDYLYKTLILFISYTLSLSPYSFYVILISPDWIIWPFLWVIPPVFKLSVIIFIFLAVWSLIYHHKCFLNSCFLKYYYGIDFASILIIIFIYGFSFFISIGSTQLLFLI